MARATPDNWQGVVRNDWIRSNVVAVTVVLTIISYVLVFGTFAGLFPYPRIGQGAVDLLSKLIAAVNATTVVVLALGWYWIRRGEIRKHRYAMLTGSGLIIAFLLMYLEKVGGGGIKQLQAPHTVKTVYFAMLGIHELLSALAVPFVIYTLVVGLTHSVSEIRRTRHAQMGRIAVSTWLISLTLGVLTFVILQSYGWTYTTDLPF